MDDRPDTAITRFFKAGRQDEYLFCVLKAGV